MAAACLSMGVLHHPFSRYGKKTGANDTARLLGSLYSSEFDGKISVEVPPEKLEFLGIRVADLCTALKSLAKNETIVSLAQKASGLAGLYWQISPFRGGWHVAKPLHTLSGFKHVKKMKDDNTMALYIEQLEKLPEVLAAMGRFTIDPCIFTNPK